MTATRGGADALLAVAVRLLPARRAEWGRAMRAELAGVAPLRSRWGFALGCVAAIATTPATLASVGAALAWAGLVALTVVWAVGIAFVPLRVESLVLVALLAAGVVLGRTSAVFGVSADRPSRTLRGAGQLVIGVVALALVAGYRFQPRSDPTEQASAGMPILSAALVAYLVGVTAMTAQRSRLGGRSAVIIGGAALAATAVCFAPMTVHAVVPQSAGWTILLVIASGVVAAALAAPGATTRQRAAAGLSAGASAGLLVPVIAVGLLELVPAMVPDLSGPMLASATAAQRLQQSQGQAQDAFVAALLIGAVLAVLAALAALVRPRAD